MGIKKTIAYLLIFQLSYFSALPLAHAIDPLTLPTGGTVISGTVNIQQPSISQLNVNQTSNQAIVNWNTFNVGSQASVHFNQPGATSSILNNVLSGQSIINGSIYSNGRLYITNPTGILTGPTSAIKAEGVVLSTLNLSQQNFLNNNLQFNTTQSSNIENQGSIEGKYVALISTEVNNKGAIVSNVATTLAAGDDILLGISDSNSLTVRVNPSTLKTLVNNEGSIKTQNGIVTIKTDVAQSLVDSTIKLPSAKADGLISENGVLKLVSNSGSIQSQQIKIDSGSKGSTTISGVLNTNSETGQGGMIEITGKEIDINLATISADGSSGGGRVLIGGDWQGSGDLLQATYVDIDKDTTISANAINSGSGGTIVAWSDITDSNSTTKVSGTLSAQGIDGNGGQIETSGAELNINGIRVNTSSLSGNYGNWLVDPTNLIIGSSEASTYTSNLSSTDLTLTADETITLNNNISYSGARDSTLTFNAATTVLNADISSSNGSLSLDFNSIIEIGGANTSIATNGGNVDISGNIRAVSGQTGNNFTINAGTGNVTFSSNVVEVVGDYSAGFAQGSFTSISDLDFSGTFLNAINIGGDGTTIGDAVFQSKLWTTTSISNATASFQNNGKDWSSYLDYGNTGLNTLMAGMLWSDGNSQSPYVQFTNATPGQKYKIQALFKERCCNRYFDIYVDGTKIVDDFKPQSAGSDSAAIAKYLTYQFEAASSNVMFRMSGRTAEDSGTRLHFDDVNPILNAISIEAVNASTAINNLSINANQFNAANIAIGGNLTVTNSGSSTISGVVSGSTALTKSGTGTLALSGSNTYTGSTTISQGTLSVSSSANLGATPGSVDADNIIFNGGTLNTTADFTLGTNKGITLTGAGTINTNASSTLTYGGVITGSGAITKTGSGTLKLTGNNNYSGTTTVNEGKLDVYTSNSLGSGNLLLGDATTLFSSSRGGAISLSNDISFSGTPIIDISFGTGTDFILSGDISGSGKLSLAGDVNSRWLRLTGNNTFSGGIDINTSSTVTNKPILEIGSATALGSGTVTSYGTVDYQNVRFSGNHTVGNNFTTANSNAKLNINTNGTTSGISGDISGAGSFTKSGTGTLTLSGSNSYSGTTNITGGTLIAGSINSLGSIPQITSSSGTFGVSNGVVLPSLITNGTITFSSGISTTGTQTYNNDVIVSAGSIASPAEFTTTNANITFGGTLKGSGNAKTKSITINAGTGDLLFEDRVGYAFNSQTFDPDNTADSFYKMIMTADNITLKGDVMTFEEQVYNGNILIGSTGSNGTTRTLLSIDPKITFNGTIDDTVAGSHTLVAKAIAVRRDGVVPGTPEINFTKAVSSKVALAGYEGLTGYQVVSTNYGTIDSDTSFGSVSPPPAASSGSSNSSNSRKQNKSTDRMRNNNQDFNDMDNSFIEKFFNLFSGNESRQFSKAIKVLTPGDAGFDDNSPSLNPSRTTMDNNKSEGSRDIKDLLRSESCQQSDGNNSNC